MLSRGLRSVRRVRNIDLVGLSVGKKDVADDLIRDHAEVSG